MSQAQPDPGLPPPVMPLPPLSASVSVRGLPAARTAVPLPPDRQVFFELSPMPWVQDGPGLRRKTIAGETTRFSLLEVTTPENGSSPIQRFPFERTILQVEGAIQLDIGGYSLELGPMQVAVIPPGVPHTLTAMGSGEGSHNVALEFCSIGAAAETARAIGRDRAQTTEYQVLMIDLDRMLWDSRPNDLKFKRVEGDSSYFHLWSFPPSTMYGTDQPGHHHTAEQISYVLQGHAEMRIGDRIRSLGPGALLIIPSDVDHLPMSPINQESVLLLDYQPIIRPMVVTPESIRENGENLLFP